MGPNGIGNSADNLPGSGPGGGGGGGGGGNGPGDFMLVLQDVVKPGTHVKKGDVVAEFDRQYMLNRLDDYRSAVSQSEANLKKQKANLEITRKAHEQLITSAKGTLEKARLDMKTIPVLSDIDAERTKLALDEAEARYQQLLKEVKFVQIAQDADIRNAELQLEQSKLELKRAEMNADKMIAKAPIDGLTVMQSMFRGGDFGQIQQGDQLWPGMFYMQIVDTSSMIINASVNQVDADELKLGQKAMVHFDAYPGLELPAHVVSIAAVTKSGGFRASFVKEVPVRLKIDKMDRRVIPDLSVSADVVIGSDERVATVAPAASVFREGSLAKPFVYVQEALGWRRRDVELGLANNLTVAIKNGLRPGEVVALDRPQSLEETP
jgi:multidrug resistance efflux pump